MRRVAAVCLLALAGGVFPGWAQQATDAPAEARAAGTAPADAGVDPAQQSVDGGEIFRQFREGLAEPSCTAQASDAQYRRNFAHAPNRLADRDDDILPLFGYVVGAMRQAGLPTEYALIPFVESGYHPGAANGAGPAGLWQFVSLTARNHGVRMRKGYDGRLSPVESTQAAVRYLKTLHDMFDGNWRLAIMAYNAGENRIVQAVRRAGRGTAMERPTTLPGVSRNTAAYVDKLHALACVLEDAGERPEWLASLARPVAHLQATALPADYGSLSAWAAREGRDVNQIAGLNPAVSRLRGGLGGETMWVLAGPRTGTPAVAADLRALGGGDAAPASSSAPAEPPATHTVVRGETLSAIARRYGLATAQLIRWNALGKRALIKPGMVLKLADPLR